MLRIFLKVAFAKPSPLCLAGLMASMGEEVKVPLSNWLVNCISRISLLLLSFK